THDVLEEAGGAAEAALIGEVGGSSPVVSEGGIQLGAEEAPGAAADVDKVVSGSGCTDHGRGGVMAGDGDDRNPFTAQLLAELRPQQAQLLARLDDGGQDPVGDAQLAAELPVPVSGSGVQQVGGGGDGVL